jgi:ribosomal protein S18
MSKIHELIRQQYLFIYRSTKTFPTKCIRTGGLQIDRQKKLSVNKTWSQFMFRTSKVIDYKKTEMLSKFTSQNGRILSLKNIHTFQSEKHFQY